LKVGWSAYCEGFIGKVDQFKSYSELYWKVRLSRDKEFDPDDSHSPMQATEAFLPKLVDLDI